MYLIFTNCFVHRIGNCISMMTVSQMIQHVYCRIQHRNWIRNIFTSNCCTSITSSRLKDCVLQTCIHDLNNNKRDKWPLTYMISIIFAGQQSGSTSNATNNIRHNSTVQIGHVHHLELMWIRDQLHAAIINDHIVVLDVWIVFGHASWSLQK